MVVAPILPYLRYRRCFLATGFYLNKAANEQSGQDERGVRHSRNSLPTTGPISLVKIAIMNAGS
jgi:hypothetical protein